MHDDQATSSEPKAPDAAAQAALLRKLVIVRSLDALFAFIASAGHRDPSR